MGENNKFNNDRSQIEWPTPEPLVSVNPTDCEIGPHSVLPEPGQPSEYYEEGMDVYSSEYQTKIVNGALRIDGIRLLELVFILANEDIYDEYLPKLWEYSGLNENEKFPNWDPIMSKNPYSRALTWYWLLCGWTIFDKYKKKKYSVKSYYFGSVEDIDGSTIWERKIKLIPLNKWEDGEFKKIKKKEVQSPHQYIKLKDFKKYLHYIGSEAFKGSIPLPKSLYPIFNDKDSINNEIIEIMKKSAGEVNELYQAILNIKVPPSAEGADKKWQEAALRYLENRQPKFNVIQKYHLKFEDIYAVSITNAKRDFVAHLHQKILIGNQIEVPGITKLYTIHKKLINNSSVIG